MALAPVCKHACAIMARTKFAVLCILVCVSRLMKRSARSVPDCGIDLFTESLHSLHTCKCICCAACQPRAGSPAVGHRQRLVAYIAWHKSYSCLHVYAVAFGALQQTRHYVTTKQTNGMVVIVARDLELYVGCSASSFATGVGRILCRPVQCARLLAARE